MLLLSVIIFIAIDNPDFPRTQLTQHIAMGHVERVRYAVPLEARKPEHLPERVGLQLTRLHKVASIDQGHNTDPSRFGLPQLYRVKGNAQTCRSPPNNFTNKLFVTR